MTGEWMELSLREAGVQLLDCEHKTPPPAEDGYPYIAIPQLKNGRIDLTNVRLITRADYIAWTRKTKPQGWDVIVSRRCNPGETAVVSPGFECALGQNLVILRSDGTKVYPPFLRWLVRSPAWSDQVRTFINVGAVFDSLKCADIPNFRLPILPMLEQQAIACILGAFDDKIELNRRMSRTLEATARAIFKSWFVDFDPVRAKADVRGEHPDWTDERVGGAACPGLKPDLAALFPDAFEDSELGEIPKGWRVIGLNETGIFLNGLALQNYPPGDGNSLPVIKIAQLRKGSTEAADRASAEIASAYIVNDGDVLFSWSGSLQCVLWTGGPGALNQHLFKVTPAQFSKWYYYLWIHEHLPNFRHIAAGKATTMGHIQRQHLVEAKVVVPPAPFLARVNRIIGPLIEAAVSRSLECRHLALIRDALLSPLVSGELAVTDAERIVRRAP